MILTVKFCQRVNFIISVASILVMLIGTIGYTVVGSQWLSYINPWWSFNDTGSAPSVYSLLISGIAFNYICLATVLLYFSLFCITFDHGHCFFISGTIFISVFGIISIGLVSGTLSKVRNTSKCAQIKNDIIYDIDEGNGYWSLEQIGLFNNFTENNAGYWTDSCTEAYKKSFPWAICNIAGVLAMIMICVPLTLCLSLQSWDVPYDRLLNYLKSNDVEDDNNDNNNKNNKNNNDSKEDNDSKENNDSIELQSENELLENSSDSFDSDFNLGEDEHLLPLERE